MTPSGQFPSPEAERLAALNALDILDTPAEQAFDHLTELACAALGVASSAVSLIDHDRQWFKARSGIPFDQTARDIAFCDHAVAARALLVVPDAREEERFANNPLVTADGGIRFYAGAPLILANGHCVGTLCVFDPSPRDGLTDGQSKTLQILATVATDLIESRRGRRMGEIAAKVVEATPDAVLATDDAGHILYCNPSAERLFGRRATALAGHSVDLLSPTRYADDYARIFAQARDGTAVGPPPSELTGVRADGSEFPVEVSLARWGQVEGVTGVAAVIRDVSQRAALQKDREHARAFLDTVVTHLPAMLFVKDAATLAYVTVNRAGERVMGRPAVQIIGSTDSELFPAQGPDYERRDRDAVAAGGGAHVFESTFERADGVTARLRTTRVLIDGPDRQDQYILGVTEDMTPMRTAEAEALRLAQYDDLTGLLNRASASNRLHRLVQAGVPFAMLSVDLRRFRTVNEQWGQAAGDSLLVEAARRLRGVVGPADWVARVGVDEFAILVIGDAVGRRAETIAEAAVAAMAEPFRIDRADAHLEGAVGVVLHPQDGGSAEVLRENVDLALHRAKGSVGGQACFFNPQMDAEARDRRTLEADLRSAVADRQITLAFQPLVSATTGRITSAEALARWTHPTRGPIRPDVFIPLAEEAGLIDSLGEQLLRQACLEASTWHEDLRVAVNLSPLQFASDRLLETVETALSASGLPPHRLQLEVTEGLVLRDVDRTFRQLEALRRLGIQVLIDDFGVGYSSLSYFQRFPFDKVKLDKSFIDDVSTSRAARAIIGAVVGLGLALDMGVVAEGVETEEQLRLLMRMGCTHLQGYLFSPPLPASAFRILVEAWTPITPPQSAAASSDIHKGGNDKRVIDESRSDS